ncbi:DUF3021 domain-containing protein [Bacillus sp. JCM 19034]|uniref:DUF3021 domain-containing protein n=1 Tax=Bacillus sp. JCM 19034 TaxID=1481928 RepID=UPI0007843012|nr:DUF3021 domain-containing protein [Bacillus sp. JCM 19034]
MIIEVIKRLMTGIAFSGMATFIAITIVNFTNGEATISELWLYMLCSNIIGIYFGLSSFIFGENGLSVLKQTLIHFFLSISFYSIIALAVGWVPLTLQAILLSSLIFLITYAIFFTGYYMYYKRIEESLNDSLSKKD